MGKPSPAFLGVEFDRKAAHVALGIGGAPFPGHCRAAQKAFGFLSDLRKHFCPGVTSYIVGDGQRAIGRRALGVNHSFGNPFPVEMSVLLKQRPVLNEHRPFRTGRQ